MRVAFFPFILIALLIMSTDSGAQGTPSKSCSAPECNQFNFWLGDWELSYNDTGKGTNSITKEMNGCVIHEHFHDPSNGYLGESWSVYNTNLKKWQQTWVDNQGAYIALAGSFSNGRMILFTEPQQMPNGTRKQNRMTFYNIEQNSFDWDWEASTDGGKTWTMGWHIHYKRK